MSIAITPSRHPEIEYPDGDGQPMAENSSAIVLPNRVEDIDRDSRLIQGFDPVHDPARNAPEVAGVEYAGNAPDRELDPALEQNSHLFVGMRMILDDRARLESHHAKHQLIACHGTEHDSRKNLIA
jgi:hypothetical protein